MTGHDDHCRILTVATWQAAIRGGKKNETSKKKKLRCKAKDSARMKSIAMCRLSSCEIIARPMLLKRHGCRVQTEMSKEGFRTCHFPPKKTHRTRAFLKIISAYKLKVMGRGCVKRSQSAETTSWHVCARAANASAINPSVLFHRHRAANTDWHRADPDLCFLTSKWMLLLCFLYH